jgi:hypothetical protein
MRFKPARSFFVGPTSFYAARERRHWGRWFKAILHKGDTEPIELMISVTMLESAVVLLLFRQDAVLAVPHLFGHALGLCGTLGIVGLATRTMPLRVMFAFFGIMLRSMMAILYLQRDWHDPAWVHFLMGASALAWIAIRLVCEAAKRYGMQLRICKGV